MKKIALTGLSALTLSLVFAQHTAISAMTSTTQISPASLVTKAYRGYFKNQGIPGYLGFLYKYSLGRIDAEKLVKFAVNANLLPKETLTNRRYLNAVKTQLKSQLPMY